jgi:hypothetical protein
LAYGSGGIKVEKSPSSTNNNTENGFSATASSQKDAKKTKKSKSEKTSKSKTKDKSKEVSDSSTMVKHATVSFVDETPSTTGPLPIKKKTTFSSVEHDNKDTKFEPDSLVKLQQDHDMPTPPPRPASMTHVITSRQDTFESESGFSELNELSLEETLSSNTRKPVNLKTLNLPSVNFVFNIDVRGGVKVGVDSIQSLQLTQDEHETDVEGAKASMDEFPFKSTPTWDFCNVVLQLIAVNRIRKWYLEKKVQDDEKKSYYTKQTSKEESKQRYVKWFGTPDDSILMGPYHTVALARFQLKLKRYYT